MSEGEKVPGIGCEHLWGNGDDVAMTRYNIINKEG